MKIHLLILFSAFSFLSNAQLTTTIVDANFENYLETHDADGLSVLVGDPSSMGNGILLDSTVLTANITTVDSLDVSYHNIYDLSGIENFSSLKYLKCSNNNIDSLNLNYNDLIKELYCSSNNILTLIIDNLNDLDILDCSFNNITVLNLPQNNELDSLICYNNQLNTLDLNGNVNLEYLYCGMNNLTSLDLSPLYLFGGISELECQNNPITNINISGNTSLKHLSCHNNMLQEIDLSDNYNLHWLSIGNNSLFTNYNNLTFLDLSYNQNITNFYCSGNINLYCIQVYDTVQTSGWTDDIDPQQYYSDNCNLSDVNDVLYSKNNLISIIDIYGRKFSKISNSILFFIYQDGSVEKRVVLDK